MTSLRATLSYRAWKRRSRSRLAQRYSTRWRARTLSTPKVRLTDLADTALVKSLCSFPCIDEVRALPHVAGFPDLGVLRPAPTAARPPTPLPGFAGYRRGIASRHPAGDGAETALPSSQDDHPHVQRPYTPEGSSAPAPGPRALSVAFAVRGRARLPLSPPAGGPLDDACSGFTHVADRAVDPAPLRTRPLDHARGLHYQGPRHLPGPDSHRQAALNLSLLRHAVLLSLTAPKQSRRTTRKEPRAWSRGPAALLRQEHKPAPDPQLAMSGADADSRPAPAFTLARSRVGAVTASRVSALQTAHPMSAW